jgi:hypothetical protein
MAEALPTTTAAAAAAGDVVKVAAKRDSDAAAEAQTAGSEGVLGPIEAELPGGTPTRATGAVVSTALTARAAATPSALSSAALSTAPPAVPIALAPTSARSHPESAAGVPAGKSSVRAVPSAAFGPVISWSTSTPPPQEGPDEDDSDEDEVFLDVPQGKHGG